MDEWPGQIKSMFSRQKKLWLKMDHLQKEVGRLIISSSDMENKLHFLFMTLIHPADETSALRVLEDQQSLEKKINLVDLIIKMQCTKEEAKIWDTVRNLLNESKSMRNYVAHQSAWISETDEEEEIHVYLGPHSVAPRKTKIKEATALQIGEACNNILKARAEMMDLLRIIGIRKGLAKQK